MIATGIFNHGCRSKADRHPLLGTNNKKKPPMSKIKHRKRPPLTREALFPKKVAREQMRNDYGLFITRMGIEQAFPDRQERLAYIDALIDGLEKEPIV